MSDYSQTTTFANKDPLSSDDPSKLILGSDVDVEYAAISTAIATKYDEDDLAPQGSARAGTSNTELMTPLRVYELVEWLSDATETQNYFSDSTTLTTAGSALLARAGGIYTFEGFIRGKHQGGDIKIALAFVDTPQSGLWNAHAIDAAGVEEQHCDSDPEGVLSFTGLTNGSEFGIYLTGCFVANASTTSTFGVEFAKNSATGNDTIVYEGSWIQSMKMG